jgi:hypothetical protein
VVIEIGATTKSFQGFSLAGVFWSAIVSLIKSSAQEKFMLPLNLVQTQAPETKFRRIPKNWRTFQICRYRIKLRE